MKVKFYTIVISWRGYCPKSFDTIIHIEERFLIDTIKTLPLLDIEKLEVMEGII